MNTQINPDTVRVAFERTSNSLNNMERAINDINHLSQQSYDNSNQIIANFKNYMFEHWDECQEMIKDAEERKEQFELRTVQMKNKYLRNLIKDVKWDGKACIMYWADDTYTKAVWDDCEAFDPEKALLVCIGRKFFEQNYNVLNQMLRKYEDAGWDHYYKNFFDNE